MKYQIIISDEAKLDIREAKDYYNKIDEKQQKDVFLTLSCKFQ